MSRDMGSGIAYGIAFAGIIHAVLHFQPGYLVMWLLFVLLVHIGRKVSPPPSDRATP